MDEEVRTWSPPPSPSGPEESDQPARARPDAGMEVHGQTSMGSARARNREQFLITDLGRRRLYRQWRVDAGIRSRWRSGDRGKLLAVAGGLDHGGRERGFVTLDSIAGYVTATMSWVLSNQAMDHAMEEAEPALLRARVLEELVQVLPRCRFHMRRIAEEHGCTLPHGGTITLAHVMWPDLYIVHVGSSRCYLFRWGSLQPLTAGGHRPPERSGDWQGDGDPTGGDGATAQHVSLQAGDRILLCTAGLTRHLHDAQIAAHLRVGSGASHTCDRLIRAARQSGSSDNITVVLARF